MVRFTCDRCGKRYAVKGEPVPGRKYRVTCKGCGHVILFTGGEAGLGPAPEPAAAAPVHAQATPASELLPQTPAPEAAGAPRPERDPFAPPDPVSPAPAPARAGPHFVELFGDGGVDAPSSATDDAPPSWATDDPPPPRATDDPPPWPSSTRTSRQLRKLAMVVAAAWVLILAAAFGVWLWRRGHPPVQSASAPSLEPGATAGAPAPPPAPALATDPATGPPQPGPDGPPAAIADATPEPAPPDAEPPAPPLEQAPEVSKPPAPAPSPSKPGPPARVKPPARKPARPEQRAAVQPPPPAAPAVPAPEPAAPAPLSSLPAGLTDVEIQRVLGIARSAFQKCLRDPSRGLAEPLGARQVTLRFNVSPSGEVGYATIDDVVISSAPVGQCLKGAARALVFPAFRGDPIKVDAPVSIPER